MITHPPERILLSESSKLVIQRGRTNEIAKQFLDKNQEKRDLAKPSHTFSKREQVAKLTKFFENEAKKQLPSIPIINATRSEIPHKERIKGIQLEKPSQEIQKEELEKEVQESVNTLLQIIDEALIYEDEELKETVSKELKEILENYRKNVFNNLDKETYNLFHQLYQYSTSKIENFSYFAKMIHEYENKDMIPIDEFFARKGKMDLTEFKSLYPDYPITFKEQLEILRDYVQGVCSMINLFKSLKTKGIDLEKCQ